MVGIFHSQLTFLFGSVSQLSSHIWCSDVAWVTSVESQAGLDDVRRVAVSIRDGVSIVTSRKRMKKHN